MNPFVLAAIPDSDKRLIISFLMLFILVFVILSYLGALVIAVTKSQGLKIDDQVSDVVRTRVITDPNHFRSYAQKKNVRLFYKQAQIPVIIMISACLILLIRAIFYQDWSYNPFNKVDGFLTILPLFDFKAEGVMVEVFGIPMIAKFPPLLEDGGQPRFVLNAWASYLFVPAMATGLIWYWVTLQAFIGRFIRIKELKTKIFSKKLDNFNQNDQISNNMDFRKIQEAKREIEEENRAIR